MDNGKRLAHGQSTKCGYTELKEECSWSVYFLHCSKWGHRLSLKTND